MQASQEGQAVGAVYVCLAETLPIPAHVQSDIEGTRALDGTREADWEGFTSSWRYDPSDGLSIQIRLAE